MTVLYRESDGTAVRPDPAEELGAGGQARVLAVQGNPAWVAKLYHDPAEAQARKLRVMLAHPPLVGSADGQPSAGAAGPPALVWPADLLRDGQGRTVGLLMRRVSGMQRVFELYNPATRRVKSPHFNYARLHRTARNVAAAFQALHAAGYVVGDANESNVLVDAEGNVTVIDTDSFQVRDPESGEVFRCPVGRPEFAPPELQGRVLAEVDRTPEHDRFALGVLVFQLLMEGTHPFAGQLAGPGDPPPIPERIARGLYPYTPGGEAKPPRNAPPIDLLHPLLRGAFRRCFEVGHADPSARPAAHEWIAALEAAEAALVECAGNRFHRYGRHLAACPWCERARALGGRDPFPTREAVARGEHLKAPQRRRVQAPTLGTGRKRFASLGRTRFFGAPADDAVFAGGAVLLWVFFLHNVSGLLWLIGLVLAVSNVRKRMNTSPAAAAGTVVAGVLATMWWLMHMFQAVSPAMPVQPVEPLQSFRYSQPAAPDPLPYSDGRAYESSEVTRQPLPLWPDSLAAAVRFLSSPAMDANTSPAITFAHVVVGADGLVERGTVRFGVMKADPAGLARAEAVVERVPFRPAQFGDAPVRSEVVIPVLWKGGTPRLVVESAPWADAEFIRANPALADTAGAHPALAGGIPVDATSDEAFQRALQRAFAREAPDAAERALVTLWFYVDAAGNVEPSTVHVLGTADPRLAVVAAVAADSLTFDASQVREQSLDEVRMTALVRFDAAGPHGLVMRMRRPGEEAGATHAGAPRPAHHSAAVARKRGREAAAGDVPSLAAPEPARQGHRFR